MRLGMAADHAGYEMKNMLASWAESLGHSVMDLGTHGPESVDYPDYAQALGLAVLHGQVERGVLLCGSGVGACVAANKLPGIRACVCHDSYSARQGVEHDDMNILVLGSRVIGPELAKELLLAFVSARFSGEERHRRRLEKVARLETQYKETVP